MKKVYENDGNVFAKYLQHNYPQLYSQGVWIFGDWDKALQAAGFAPDKMRMQGSWDPKRSSRSCRTCEIEIYPLMPTTC